MVIPSPSIPTPSGVLRSFISAWLTPRADNPRVNAYGQRPSMRGLARQMGVNESTLRSTYRREGGQFSQQTVGTFQSFARANPGYFWQREVRTRTVRDASLFPGQAIDYGFTPPPNATAYRIVVRNSSGRSMSFTDPNTGVQSSIYEDGDYATFLSGDIDGIPPEDMIGMLPAGWTAEAVVWDVAP